MTGPERAIASRMSVAAAGETRWPTTSSRGSGPRYSCSRVLVGVGPQVDASTAVIDDRLELVQDHAEQRSELQGGADRPRDLQQRGELAFRAAAPGTYSRTFSIAVESAIFRWRARRKASTAIARRPVLLAANAAAGAPWSTLLAMLRASATPPTAPTVVGDARRWAARMSGTPYAAATG